MTEFFGPAEIEKYGIDSTKRSARPATPDPKPEPPATRVVDSFTSVYDGGVASFIDESNTNRQTSVNATLRADYDIAMNAAYEGGMQGLVQDSYVNRLNSEAEEQAQTYDQATAIAMEGGMGSIINDSIVSRSQVEADQLIEDNTYEPGYEVLHENTSTIKQLAADIYYGGHVDDSMPADYLLAALQNRLSDDEFSQLNEQIELIGWYDSQSLKLFEDEGQPVSIDGDVGELGELEALAQGIYDDSYTTQPSNGGVFFDPMSPNPAVEVLLPNTVAMEIEQIAVDDPGRALLVKMLIDEKLTPTQRAEVDRILGGGATTSDNVAAAVRDPWQGVQGAAKTFVNTPGELLELTWDVNNLMQPGASADFSHDTFGFMTMDMDSRAEMGGGVVYDFVTLFGGPGALSRSGLSIVQEGSEFVIKHGGRRIAGISSEAVDTLMPTLRNNPGSSVDTPARQMNQEWWGSDGDPAPLRMNNEPTTRIIEVGDSDVLVGSSRSGMLRKSLKIITNDPDHPLRFLLDPSGTRFKPATLGREHHALAAQPDVIEMGHIVSRKTGEEEHLMLQMAYENQMDNWAIEAPRVDGHIADQGVVEIGGIAVSRRTAKDWEEFGWLDKGTVAAAPIVRIPD